LTVLYDGDGDGGVGVGDGAVPVAWPLPVGEATRPLEVALARLGRFRRLYHAAAAAADGAAAAGTHSSALGVGGGDDGGLALSSVPRFGAAAERAEDPYRARGYVLAPAAGQAGPPSPDGLLLLRAVRGSAESRPLHTAAPAGGPVAVSLLVYAHPFAYGRGAAAGDCLPGLLVAARRRAGHRHVCLRVRSCVDYDITFALERMAAPEPATLDDTGAVLPPNGLAAHFVPTAEPVSGVIFARECVHARAGRRRRATASPCSPHHHLPALPPPPSSPQCRDILRRAAH